MALNEAFTLDGLALNALAGPLRVLEADMTPPSPRYQWATSVDTEGSRLVAEPGHENREITLKIAVDAQATTDLALAQIAAVRDKLRRASILRGGIALVWTPADGTKSCTFDVRAGEVTGLPVDYESGWFAKSPEFTIKLIADPYWRGSESGTSTATSGTTPFAVLEVPTVTGDIPAWGRLLITDSATQNRRHVEWGVEGPSTYNSGLGLLIDSDAMVTAGFAGAQATTWAGAYDVGGGNTQITATAYAGTTAIAGTGNLSHVGTFRVKARIIAAAASFGQPTTPRGIRLSWQANDGPFASNAWVTPNAAAVSALTWQEVDLGLITIPQPITGAQRWQGRVEVYGNATGISYALDYLVLVPAGDGYGVASSTYAEVAGVVVGSDSFVATTAGLGLNVRTAPAGGSWATSGEATDWIFADQFQASDGVESITRQVNTDTTTGRLAVLGTTNHTDTQVDVRFRNGGISTAYASRGGLIARWTDASNHLRVRITEETSVAATFAIETVIGGTVAVLATTTWARAAQAPYRARLYAFASGRVLARIMSDAGATITELTATSTAVATGGTLASGESGIWDFGSGSDGTHTRYYTEFAVAVPPAEPFVLYSGREMQIRYDATIRQDSTGTYTGAPQSYEGSRFVLQPGTSRVLVKARRNNITAATDPNVTDNTTIQVFWTPRGLVVPR